VPITVVHALEQIDVDHQAGHASAVPLRTRQLFLQSLLQIAAVVPAREEVGDAGSQQARTVDRILDTNRGYRTQMPQKIGSMVTREARRIAAAETQSAGGSVFARQ